MMLRRGVAYNCTVDDVDEFEYWCQVGETAEFMASNSLLKLKRAIKDKGLRIAWLQTKAGCFSYGQNCVDQYPYRPRYSIHVLNRMHRPKLEG